MSEILARIERNDLIQNLIQDNFILELIKINKLDVLAIHIIYNSGDPPFLSRNVKKKKLEVKNNSSAPFMEKY